MAGRRSAPGGTRAAAPEASTSESQTRDVLIEAARTELAAVSAGIKFWAGWVESAERYTQALDDELARLEETGDSGEIVTRVSDLTREYLRDMTQLPSAAVKEFNARLETIGKPKAKRTRAARVKD